MHKFSQVRNLAIIAHVDHGKTTLIDNMLKQTHAFRDNQAEMGQELILDSNDQERERGITILAKTTSVFYKDIKINIIDTPGHADFSGEVERVIGMADGALLIVDAAEGPLPQTRFVLEQALKQNLKMTVLINKIDRTDARPAWVLNQVEELFLSLAQDEAQLHFPVLYGVGRAGKVWSKLPDNLEAQAGLTDLFETIVHTVPAPQADKDRPFMLQVTNLDFDSYKGVYAIGKVLQGQVKKGQTLNILEADRLVGTGQAQFILTSEGLERVEVEVGLTGDIIAITGIDSIKIGQTLADTSVKTGLPMIKLSEPTLKIHLAPNTSPFAGKEGEFVTIRQIEDRLKKEQKTNIGLKIEPANGGFMIAGRGELHLSVLIESMRREGFELEIGKPEVIVKEIDGVKHEPFEELTVEIASEYVGVIVEELGKRYGQMLDSITDDKGIARMVFKISSRNLLGFRSQILTKTRGNGIFASRFIGFFPVEKAKPKLRNGVLIATETGQVTAYALESVQQRGEVFVKPGDQVYMGQIVGVSKVSRDIEVNVCKAKKLTNFRSNADIATVLKPPVVLSLEQALDFLEDDELLEVTPKALRLRKRFLDPDQRVKAKKKASVSFWKTKRSMGYSESRRTNDQIPKLKNNKQ